MTVTASSTGTVRGRVGWTGAIHGDNLAPGIYQVALELSGFAPTRRDVTLGVGDAKAVDVTMPVAGVTEAVHVTGRRRHSIRSLHASA